MTEFNLQTFIQQLTTAAANISLYHTDHPQVTEQCRKAVHGLEQMLEECGTLELKIIKQQLICNDRAIQENTLTEKLSQSLKNNGISCVQFRTGITDHELIDFARLLSQKGQQLPPSPCPETGHIWYGALEVRYSAPPPATPTEPLFDFSEMTSSHLDSFMDLYSKIRKRQSLNIIGIKEMVTDFIDAFEAHSNILFALAPLRSMDDYVYVHSTNICLLNMAQARLIGLDKNAVQEVGIAAMLHDVGKMFIPTEILNKTGKLEPEEWDLMRQHPRLGAEYLLGCADVPYLAVVTAYEHHIGFDSKGYPATPAPYPLHPSSYMTSISDVYDALRTRRSYKEPLSLAKIKEIMLDSAGKSLHPQLTRSFLTAMSLAEGEEQTSG